jgi:RNA recognition motif-containing protein
MQKQEKRLLIENLPKDTKLEHIQKLFSKFGNLIEISLKAMNGVAFVVKEIFFN